MIYPRGNMLYTDVMVDGVRKRISTGYRKGQEAQATLVAAKLQAGETIHTKTSGVVSSSLTLQQGIKLAWAVWRNLKDQKMKDLHGRAAVDFFGADRPLQEINAALVQRWVNVLAAKGNSPATINRKLAWLSGMLRICMEQQGVPEHMPKIPALTEAPKQRGYLEDDQVSAMLAAADPEFVPLFVFLRDTGCRISEALGLEWSHCVGTSVSFVDTKAGDVRTLPLTKAVQDALQQQRDRGCTKPFPWSYKQASARFHAAAEAVGVVLPKGTSVHLMRHTAATQLIERGADIRSVQVWMGHHCVQTTEIYAKVTGNKLAKIRDLLEQPE